jgi:hypothetical protein
MTKQEQRELNSAKANIKALIKHSILDIHREFDEISQTKIGSINHKMTSTKRELIEQLEHLNKKIQEELVWE